MPGTIGRPPWAAPDPATHLVLSPDVPEKPGPLVKPIAPRGRSLSPIAFARRNLSPSFLRRRRAEDPDAEIKLSPTASTSSADRDSSPEPMHRPPPAPSPETSPEGSPTRIKKKRLSFRESFSSVMGLGGVGAMGGRGADGITANERQRKRALRQHGPRDTDADDPARESRRSSRRASRVAEDAPAASDSFVGGAVTRSRKYRVRSISPKIFLRRSRVDNGDIKPDPESFVQSAIPEDVCRSPPPHPAACPTARHCMPPLTPTCCATRAATAESRGGRGQPARILQVDCRVRWLLRRRTRVHGRARRQRAPWRRSRTWRLTLSHPTDCLTCPRSVAVQRSRCRRTTTPTPRMRSSSRRSWDRRRRSRGCHR